MAPGSNMQNEDGSITLDKDHEIPMVSPVCWRCVHLKLGGRSCKAFPGENSIPLAIWYGENQHTAPVDGDHGVRFQEKQIDPKEAADAAAWLRARGVEL